MILSLPVVLFGVVSQSNLEPLKVNGVLGQFTNIAASVDYSGAYAFQLVDSTDNNNNYGYLESETNKTGIRIGSWSLVSNMDSLTITISHDDLVSASDSTWTIPYTLGVQKNASDIAFDDTGTSSMSFNLSKPSNSPLSLSNYGLFVRLDYTLSYLDTNSYPGGYYYSTITFVASSS